LQELDSLIANKKGKTDEAAFTQKKVVNCGKSKPHAVQHAQSTKFSEGRSPMSIQTPIQANLNSKVKTPL